MTTFSLPAAKQEMMDEFKALSPTERFEFLIEISVELPRILDHEKKEEYQVSGCASNAWVVVKHENKILEIFGFADAQISKGMLAFLSQCFSGLSLFNMTQVPDSILTECGLTDSLSPSRANGALGALHAIKKQAQMLLGQE